MKPLLLTVFLFVLFSGALASEIEKGFKALSIYDYFKAKEIFYRQLKKHPAEAGFGLATIYFRNDNPFHQLDSSFKYINISKNYFSLLEPIKKTELQKNFKLTDSALTTLHDSICFKAYKKFILHADPCSSENYMQVYYSSAFIKKVMCMRDSFIFHRADRKLNAEAFKNYIYTYPQSCYLNDARNLLEFAIYMETTADKNDKAYLSYLEKYPKAKYIPYAKEELLNYYIKHKNAGGIHDFIKSYGANYPTTLAWNMLLGIEAPHHSKTELETFLTKYNDYPKREEIEEEFTFWHTPFFLIKKSDRLGYCDSNGKQMIEPMFTDAEDFNEGYAAVQKNDLYGYINKAGKTKIEFQYTEASGFANNVAIVQKDKKYFLIDYSNKILSAKYDDIAEFSEGLAIVKKNNLYGAINVNGQEIIKPAFDMMSDFSEGFSVFLKNSKYGFLDKQGFVNISAIYDWVSSFKNGQCRAQYNKLFGVLNHKGDFIIEPAFDLIDEAHNGIYLLVKNNLYGFADSTGCFISEIKYNYQPSFKTAALTDGKYMKLIGTKKQELQNINGAKYFTEHIFDEVGLPVNNFVLAKEKNKLNLYNLAKLAFSKKSLLSAVSDGKYWYLKDKKGLHTYDLSLEKLQFTLEANSASSFESNYFLTENEEGKGVVDKNGTEILPMLYDEIKTTRLSNLLYIERNEKGAYFHISTRSFIWKEEGFDSL
jgi:hypothetical protein